MSWSSCLILKEGEQVINSWNATYDEPRVVLENQKRLLRKDRTMERDTTEHQGGILVLTNQRLIWVEKKGMIGKS